MHRKPNRVRSKLASGEIAVGAAVYSWSPNLVEVAGLAGLDFVRIDNEHAWRQDASLEHLVRAAAVADVVPLVRVDGGHAALAWKALEIGVGGVIVPDVPDAATAREVARACKFPPRGTRGYSGQCWSGGWGSRAGAAWVKWSDAEPLVGVMIEDPAAVENAEAILGVDGIDFALFGPADYSMAIGLGEPRRKDAAVLAALDRTLAAARRCRKHVMLNVGGDLEEARRYVDRGVTMLEVESDIGALGRIWAAETAFAGKPRGPA